MQAGDARRDGHARSLALARTWRDGTPLPALASALAALDRPSAETVAALVRPLLAEAGWLDTVLARLIAEVRACPFVEPPLPALDSPIQSGLLLHRDRHVALFVGVGGRERLVAKRRGRVGGAVIVPGQLGLIRVLRSGGLSMSLWEGGWRDGAILPQLAPKGRLALADGDIAAIDGRTTGFVAEQASSDTALLQATIYAGAAPTACEYDAATGAFTAASAARDEASRTQLLVTLLTELDHPDADAFAAASRYPESFVRWHAMRGWAASDPDTAAPRLAEMAADDPDPELRALARETLELIAEPCPA